ncbi:MAG: hypothetical protein AB7O37_01000 [Vicinamibacteria bacterium]
MTKFLRASTSLLAALALIATAVVVCPCPAGTAVETQAGHACCASEGIKAASVCCDAGSARHEETLVPTAIPTVAPSAFVPLALAPEAAPHAADQGVPAPSAFRSPPVLRI